MGKTVAERKIAALEKQVKELEEKVVSITKSKDDYYDRYRKLDDRMENIHTVLDTLTVPRKSKKNEYSSVELSVENRLTLLMAMIGLNSVIKLKNDTEKED